MIGTSFDSCDYLEEIQAHNRKELRRGLSRLWRTEREVVVTNSRQKVLVQLLPAHVPKSRYAWGFPPFLL